MLNVAPGSYTTDVATGLPVPVIKHVGIRPFLENGLQLQVDVSLTLPIESHGWERCNLHLIGFKSKTLARTIKESPSELRKILTYSGKTEGYSILTTAIVQDSKNTDKVVYNEKKLLSATLQTTRMGMTIEYPQDPKNAYLCIMVVASQILDDQSGLGARAMDTLDFHMSLPVMETILDNNRSPLRTNVFKLEETVQGYGTKGDVWAAAAHMHSAKGLMAGASHGVGAHPAISSTKIPNLKVKDLRILDVNSSLGFSDENIKSGTTAYLSPLVFSRSSNNAVKILCAFDLLKYMIDHSSLSYLITDATSLESTARITEILVYRQRVNKQSMGNRLTPQLDDPYSRCVVSPKKLIASLSGGGVQFVQASSEPLRGIYEMRITDSNMADEGESTFKYTMEIEIVDGSAAALKAILGRLESRMKSYQNYMQKVSNFGKAGYNVAQYRELSLKSPSGDASWRTLLVEYVAALLFLRGRKGSYTPQYIIKNLLALASPTSATDGSLYTFESQINDFISRLNAALTKSPPTSGDTDIDWNHAGGPDTGVSLLRRLKYFPLIDEPYINDLDYEVGYDYMGEKLQSYPNRFSQISVQDFVSRISEEVSKYETPSPNSPNINKFGFMSPAFVKTPGNDISVKRNMSLDKSLSLLLANSRAASKGKSFTGNPSMPKVRRLDIDSLLSLEGVSYERNQQNLSVVIRQQKSGDKLEDIGVEKYFSATSHFVTDDDYIQSQTSGDSTPRYKFFFNQIDKFIDAPVIQTLVNRGAEGSMAAKPSNIQNVEGSLAFEELSLSEEKFQNMNSFEKNLLFNAVVRVEYLAGYTNGLKTPRWLPVDAALLAGLRKDKTSVLCRLSVPSQSLSVPNRYELSQYDSLFVLGTPPLRRLLVPLAADRYATILNSVEQRLKDLNPKGAGESVPVEYTCGDMMVYLHNPQREVSKSFLIDNAIAPPAGRNGTTEGISKRVSNNQRSMLSKAVVTSGGSY